MRVLIFHGYLLGGTGSNVYNANIAKALVAQGHEVHLICQERNPSQFDFVDSFGDWDSGSLSLTTLRTPSRCTVYRPNIAGLLPVYVADRYEGIEAKPFPQLSEEELERYLATNVAAVQEVASTAAPDLALANHLVMGPAVLARALSDLDIPYVVKIHGSALEYTVKPHPERFLPYAKEGTAKAKAVLVGSTHVANSLWEALDDHELPNRTRVAPPGVDIDTFQPLQADEAKRALAQTVATLKQTGEQTDSPQSPGNSSSFSRECGQISRSLAELNPEEEPTVAFLGKLIVSKGVDLLIAAWPLVRSKVPNARLAVMGFGAFEQGLRQLVEALSQGELESVKAIAAAGRELEGGERTPLRFLQEFLAGLNEQELSAYRAAALDIGKSVTFIGRLEHNELASVLPSTEILVVPSTFPEAFGMVAAEGAACGALPIVANHSGLAEVATRLGEDLPDEIKKLLRFELGPDSVPQIASKIVTWLGYSDGLRSEARDSLARTSRTHYSWQGVANDIISAAQGDLDRLMKP